MFPRRNFSGRTSLHPRRHRQPADDKHLRLRKFAKHRPISINKLMEELVTISIAAFDAVTRFRTLAARGAVKKGLAILDKLDAAFVRKSK